MKGIAFLSQLLHKAPVYTALAHRSQSQPLRSLHCIQYCQLDMGFSTEVGSYGWLHPWLH